MEPLVLAMVLAVMQATPPVPRQTPNSPASSRHSINEKAESKQNQAPSPTPVVLALHPITPSLHPVPDQHAGSQPTKANAPEPILVREVSPVPVDSFWWNRFYVIFTGLLVVVGIAGTVLARRTLKRIRDAGEQTDKLIAHAETQAKAAQDAAGAALKNATAVMNAERAWILVRMMPTGPYKKSGIGAEIEYVWEDGSELTEEDILNSKHLVPERVVYIVKNYGRTPGWVTSQWCDARLVRTINGLPQPPDYFFRRASINLEKLDDLYAPESERKGTIVIPAEDLEPAGNREAFLYVYGIIKYRDVWGGTHETRFCFYWHVPTERELNPQGFYQEGPEGYNGQT